MPEAIGIIVGFAVLVLLFKPFFGDASGFWECVKYWITPEIFSLFRGKLAEDWWAEMKLGAWLICGGIAGLAAYNGVSRLFG